MNAEMSWVCTAVRDTAASRTVPLQQAPVGQQTRDAGMGESAVGVALLLSSAAK